jgi:pimeloyl-ACP methyl ester carboxylesterase
MYPADQSSWYATAERLAQEGYLVLTFDFRGYGDSGGEKQIDLIDGDVGAAITAIRGEGAAEVVLAGASYLYLQQKQAPEPKPVPVAAAPAAPVPQAEPATHYPVLQHPETQPIAKPLPELNDSDQLALDALATLIAAEPLKNLVVAQEIVRHIVVTVDNLPRKTLALRLSPVKPVGGEFRTAGKAGNVSIAAENAARYAPYVRAAETVNARKLVNAYGRLYPLFQRAYEELGYPKGYFNDRLVVVIDHLLAAPVEAVRCPTSIRSGGHGTRRPTRLDEARRVAFY